ncbi:hypothetical protein B0H17DRAFT_128565 [Mycena rosella]|uniref:Uncharacterized protein n=1 Tax=Mycena rosella TaxID=1033263 RepID=A0AAD7GCC9_MYCRO|nr:hypothetical protein B0H17DRAFT_128565 [Mycena rosella]
MFPRLTAALAFVVVSFTASTAAVSCGVCAPTIFYSGLNRTLTLMREEGSNTVQCNYDTPAIAGFSPGCLYRVNVDGVLTFTNTGPTLTSLPGACPSIQLVTKTSC